MDLFSIKNFPQLLLLKLHKRKWDRGYGRVYRHLLKRYQNSTTPVATRVHGFDVLLNPGNTYPLMIQDAPLFNAPLVELVYQEFLTREKPIRLVDVGAATGDSVLLIKQMCPGQVSGFVCVEGDLEFFGLLSQNMRQFSNVECVQELLSREPMQIQSLIKHHLGTASATGNELVTAVPLDSVEVVRSSPVDILKIDVDGFDGAVISGARTILKTDKPSVIFEWHPKLLASAKNNSQEAFLVLEECGYEKFLWFNNVGTFSHYSDHNSIKTLTKMADYLMAVNVRADEHFDVIALSNSSKVNEIELAKTEYFRKIRNGVEKYSF